MGSMAPWNPLEQPTLLWAKVKVLDCQPPTATWKSPSWVRLQVLEDRAPTPLPAELRVLFDQPREAGQAYFYEMRGLMQNGVVPPDRGPSSLDNTGIELPALGATIWVWLEPTANGFSIPTPWTSGMQTVPMRSRWLEDTEASRAAIDAIAPARR